MNIKINSEHLGRAILYGTIFFSIWFTDFGETNISFAFFMIVLYFIFGSLFLDAMKNLWKHETVRNIKSKRTKSNRREK